MNRKKSILITNDDGYEAKGLKVLIEAVKDLAQITIVAPATQKSACGHSLTLTKPLKFIRVDDDFYKLDEGTPSDCVYLALNTLFSEKKPDLILSGINEGSNMGEDITYSGTASAAMEGVLHGIPSISFSQVLSEGFKSRDRIDYSLAKRVVREISRKILNNSFPLSGRKFLNINIPDISEKKCKGYKITKAGYRIYYNTAQVNRNPRGEEYYWLGTHKLEWIGSEDKSCDLEAIKEGYISISPIKLDMTSYEDIENLKKWIEKS